MMGNRIKETPIKHCAYCDKLLKRKRYSTGELQSLFHFNKMVYCDIECMKKSFIMNEDRKKDNVRNSRHNARQRVQIGDTDITECSSCGKVGKMDIHHINRNPFDNSLENLLVICRSCHNKIHKEKKICMICGEPQKGLGYCNKHYTRYKKYGDPLFTKYESIHR